MKRAALLLVLIGCRSTPVPISPDGPSPPSYVDIPTPAPTYDGDGGDGLGTLVGGACARLRELGCPEGAPTASGRTCYEHLTTLSAVADVPAECVRDASTVAVVRACGASNTVRFRCVR
jgi:hypothetical protein